MKIVADSAGNVHVHLRDGEIAGERRGEVIIDLNRDGHWIRGFEVIGGMVDFSVFAASQPFPASNPGGLRVVYDGDANAAYFFLPYGPRFMNLTAERQQAAQTYSHSINPESLLRFDRRGGLLSVVIPAGAVNNLDDFLFFFEPCA
uniref:Uncharacterized protein n=1 Tax=Solibacter usitatus (strain Ellin6076) TaxID=234267 RepID=Q020T3_SOLUE